MKKLTLVILTVFMSILMCSCADEVYTPEPFEESDEVSSELTTEELLIGKWELVSGNTENDEMTLYDDGTCIIGDEAGTYKVYDDEICILGGFSGQFWDHDNFVAKYRFENDKLIIDYRDGLVYNRVI